MKRLALMVLLAALAGCGVPQETPRTGAVAQEQIDTPGAGRVVVFHDDRRSVTCWAGNGYGISTIGGLSCLPDWLLVQPSAARRPIPAGAL